MDGDASLESTARERATLHHRPLVILVLCGHVLASCATRLPVVTTPTYPSYAFPTVPPELLGTPEADEHERAWLFLQAGEFRPIGTWHLAAVVAALVAWKTRSVGWTLVLGMGAVWILEAVAP